MCRKPGGIGGEDFIVEGLVGSNNSRKGSFVTFGDEFEKHRRLMWVADLVDDQQFRLDKHPSGYGAGDLGESGGEFTSQFQSAAEVDPVTELGSDHAQSDC
jgi:hypothetical protein